MFPCLSKIMTLCTVLSLSLNSVLASDQKRYVCPPCGCNLHDKIFEESGNCTECGMRLISKDAYTNEHPAISAVGQKLAFTSSRDGNQEIYVLDLKRKSETRLTRKQAADRYPAWSPDGHKIAFTSERAGADNTDIFIMNRDGTGVMQLTHNKAADLTPAWSPGGSKVAFVSNRDERNLEVYTINTDGSKLTMITDDEIYGNKMRVRWPAQDKLQFQMFASSEQEFYSFDLKTKQYQPSGLGIAEAAISPDEKTILFVKRANELRQIFSLNIVTLKKAQITFSTSGENRHPVWATNGAAIFFVSDRDGQNEIYKMKPDGSEQTRLTIQ